MCVVCRPSFTGTWNLCTDDLSTPDARTHDETSLSLTEEEEVIITAYLA
jgi:hypothetical protein